MGLKTSELAKSMLGAAESVLGEKWPEIRDYARGEAKKIAQDMVLVEKLVLKGKMSPERARLHLQIQLNSARTVFLAVEGLGILAAEQALNAALGAVRDAVNTALGFPLV